MTTIAYRDGVLAADSQVTWGPTVMPCKIKKISRLPNGSLYGFCGTVELGEIMRRSLVEIGSAEGGGVLEDRRDLDKEAFEGVIIQPDGETLFFENRTWIRMDVPYLAMGTGKEHAYGALALGASAKQAVKAAVKLDPNSGGRVISLEIPFEGKRSYVEQCWEPIDPKPSKRTTA
jgi:ATP-dependent protease HslVU (ClpYQ) peptidase subunit